MPKPAVILSHGFLANMNMCKTYAKLLAEQGYVAVIYDFCGGGLNCKSDGKSEDMTILTEKADLLALVDYLKGQPHIIPERISLLGCSQGGVVSALAAKEINPEKLILCYPAVCIPDDARKGKMMFYKFDPRNIPDLLGKIPMRLGGDYAHCVINMDIYKENILDFLCQRKLSTLRSRQNLIQSASVLLLVLSRVSVQMAVRSIV